MAGNIDVATYLKYLKLAALDPMVYSEVANMPTTDEYDLVFAQNYRVINSETLKRAFFTKTIPLVTYRAKGGKPEPIGKDALDMEEITPLDLKLETIIEANEIKNFMLQHSLRDRSLSRLEGVYKDKVDTFQFTKRKMIVNQCNELLGTGKITMQYKDQDGLIHDAYQIDYTAIDGAINSALTYADSSLHTWSSASTTASEILHDIEAMRQLGYDNSSGTLFKKGNDFVLFVGTTAMNYIIASYDPQANDFVLTRRGVNYYLNLHGKEVPIVKSTMKREYHQVNLTTGKYAETSESKLAANEIMLVDNTRGNFGVADLKYLNLSNVNTGIAVPFEVKFATDKYDEQVEMMFVSRPIAHGRTKAIIKGTVAA